MLFVYEYQTSTMAVALGTRQAHGACHGILSISM